MLRLLNFLLALILLAFPALGLADANGKLQIHYIDVGQGDGAVLISPQGQVVLFDSGTYTACEKPVAYLEQLGVSQVDYHVASHYHSDHIGCVSEVFSQIQLVKTAYDRGSSYSSASYTHYLDTVGTKRKQATEGEVITLDAGSASPVKIRFVAMNGNHISTTDENDLSVVALVEFGKFRTEFGGDLSGESTNSYKDIETSVSDLIGPIDVYKVHHHCSSHSSNETWLAKTHPTIGIVSVGNGNGYGHPTEDCLRRLHDAGVKTYWTEQGHGADPDPRLDTVVGSIVVEVAPDAEKYSVAYQGHMDEYAVHGASGVPSAGSRSLPTPPGAPAPTFAWAKKSSVYHLSTCTVVKQIKPENLVTGATPPTGRPLHQGCPHLQ